MLTVANQVITKRFNKSSAVTTKFKQQKSAIYCDTCHDQCFSLAVLFFSTAEFITPHRLLDGLLLFAVAASFFSFPQQHLKNCFSLLHSNYAQLSQPISPVAFFIILFAYHTALREELRFSSRCLLIAGSNYQNCSIETTNSGALKNKPALETASSTVSRVGLVKNA